MNILGEKVRVRDRTQPDYAIEAIWAQDKEVAAADPAVGQAYDVRKFSIETLDGEHIGTCALYNYTGDDIQLGIRIGNKDYWDKGYGTDATNILTNYAFVTLSINCIWLKVLPWNTRAIKCYEKCGFIRTGWLALDGYDFVRMEKRSD